MDILYRPLEYISNVSEIAKICPLLHHVRPRKLNDLILIMRLNVKSLSLFLYFDSYFFLIFCIPDNIQTIHLKFRA